MQKGEMNNEENWCEKVKDDAAPFDINSLPIVIH